MFIAEIKLSAHLPTYTATPLQYPRIYHLIAKENPSLVKSRWGWAYLSLMFLTLVSGNQVLATLGAVST